MRLVTMKIRPRHIRLVVVSVFAGAVLLVVAYWLGFPLGALSGRHGVRIPVETEEPVRRAHEVLVRMDREYAARLKSMQDLRLARLAPAQYLSAQDEVLSGAEHLLSRSRTPAEASRTARERLAGLSPQAGAALGRAGLDMGPAMTPDLIRARVKDPTAQRQMGGRIYELQFAACVDAILAYVAARPAETTPAGGTAK